MSRGRRIGGLAVLAMLLPSAWVGATLQERLMNVAGMAPRLEAGQPAVRLLGMGELGLAVPDESNELSVFDFAGSTSGVLEDADGWTMDSWLASRRHALEAGPHKFERTYGRGGLRIIRRSATRALGFDVDMSNYEAPDEAWLDAKVGGPLVSAVVNQQMGPATIGLSIGLENEEDRRDVVDFYAIQHQQERWVGQLAGHADLFGLQFGAAWDFERGDVLGKSEDPARFHQDDYTWSRPLNRFSLFWLLPKAGWVEGGMRVSMSDREGSERAVISWSDRSPRNPSGSDFRAEAITFHEDESDLLASTRWRLHLDRSTMIGVEASYRDWDWKVEEGVNYKGSLREGDDRASIMAGAAGVSHRWMEGRLLATLEARGSLNDREWQEDGVMQEATARFFEGGVGVEYFATRSVVLRGALLAGGEDADIDLPETLTNHRQVSGGVSWLPRGGMIQIHGAVWYERITQEEDGGTDLETGNGLGYAVGLRLLP